MKENMNNIPVITCFDVEPDPRLTVRGRQDSWKGYEGMYAFLSEVRRQVEFTTKAPAHFGWYFRLDPQIEDTYGRADWPLRTYSGCIEKTLQDGDEIGIHPHTYKWGEEVGNWVSIHDDADYCNSCIELCFRTYEDFFGSPCRSLRMGDKWISNEAVQYAEKLGMKYDLTLEPGHESRPHVVRNEFFCGQLPSFAGVPQHPYLPWKLDFRIPDKKRKDGLWMIPLSSDKIEGVMGATQRFSRKVLRGRWHEQDYLTLNFEMKPWIFRKLVNQQLKKLNQPYLAIVSRVDISIKKDTYHHMCANLRYLLTFQHASRLRFSTPDEAMALLGYQSESGTLGMRQTA